MRNSLKNLLTSVLYSKFFSPAANNLYTLLPVTSNLIREQEASVLLLLIINSLPDMLPFPLTTSLISSRFSLAVSPPILALQKALSEAYQVYFPRVSGMTSYEVAVVVSYEAHCRLLSALKC